MCILCKDEGHGKSVEPGAAFFRGFARPEPVQQRYQRLAVQQGQLNHSQALQQHAEQHDKMLAAQQQSLLSPWTLEGVMQAAPEEKPKKARLKKCAEECCKNLAGRPEKNEFHPYCSWFCRDWDEQMKRHMESQSPEEGND